MTVFHMLFSAKGRIRRRDYWLWSMGVILVVVIVVFGIAFVTRNAKADTISPAGILLTILLPLIYWAQICLQIKRWHDRNKSGAMIFINLIPIVGQWWAFAETCVLDGTKGANKFGPSPKGIDTTHRVF